MSKQIALYTLLFLVVATAALAQKKNVRKAGRALDNGELKEAINLIEPALTDEKTKDDPDTYYTRGQIYQAVVIDSSGQYSDVENPLKKAADSYRKVQSMVKENDPQYVLSDQQLQQLWGLYVNAGIIAFQDKNFEKSVKEFDMAKVVKPKDTTAYLYAGISAQSNQQLDVALENFEQLVNLDYVDKDIYNTIIYILLNENKDNEKALEYIREAKELFPETSDFLRQEIVILINTNKAKDALDRLSEAIEKDPDDEVLYYNRAFLYEQLSGEAKEEDQEQAQEYNDKAVADYKKAIEIKPDYFDANFNLAANYYNRAAEILQQAQNMDLKEYQKRGKEVEEKSKVYFKDALPYLEKSEELRPDDTDVLNTLQTVYTRLGMDDKAEAISQKMNN
jgi:tetratricopeptide (TPR) repeat protein